MIDLTMIHTFRQTRINIVFTLIVFCVFQIPVFSMGLGESGLVIRATGIDSLQGEVNNAKLICSGETLWILWLDNRNDPERYGGSIFVQGIREDESLVDDFLKSSVKIPGTKPSAANDTGSRVPVSAGMDSFEEEGEKDYSLKRRVSRAVAAEEKALIAEVLNKVNWNRRKASEILGVSYRSLLYKIKEYKINEIK